jgi:hypothetical protein
MKTVRSRWPLNNAARICGSAAIRPLQPHDIGTAMHKNRLYLERAAQ